MKPFGFKDESKQTPVSVDEVRAAPGISSVVDIHAMAGSRKVDTLCILDNFSYASNPSFSGQWVRLTGSAYAAWVRRNGTTAQIARGSADDKKLTQRLCDCLRFEQDASASSDDDGVDSDSSSDEGHNDEGGDNGIPSEIRAGARLADIPEDELEAELERRRRGNGGGPAV